VVVVVGLFAVPELRAGVSVVVVEATEPVLELTQRTTGQGEVLVAAMVWRAWAAMGSKALL
jgi:hypothetical protein